MGTKNCKGRGAATNKMKQKNPAAKGHSSAQIIKHPRMKKSLQKRQIKSRFSRRRPVDNTSQQKMGRGRSQQDSDSYKRIIVFSQNKKLKTYCSRLTGGHKAKFSRETSTNPIPSKTANKQGQSNKPGKVEEDRKAGSNGCRTENPPPPLWERSRVGSTRENQRSKLIAADKRRYQSVSEYQFINPAKAMFHCTRESVKQQLRSIYLGPRGQKSLKPTHQCTQMPHHPGEKNETQGENTRNDASCPVGSEFLRSKHPNTIPHGLTSLMHKIDKLVLVDKKAPPCTPAGFPHSPQGQHQPPPMKSSLPGGILKRRRSFKKMNISPDEARGTRIQPRFVSTRSYWEWVQPPPLAPQSQDPYRPRIAVGKL